MVTMTNKLILGVIFSVFAMPSVATDIETRVANNENKQSGLAQRVTDVESQISSLPDYSNEIADLENRVTTLENSDGSTGTNPKVMKYIGQTTATIHPNKSVIEKNAMCVAEFGDFNPPSKMSTSQELMRSINDDTYKNNPVLTISLLRSTRGVNGTTVDYSGSISGDCMTYFSNTTDHLTFNPGIDKFSQVNCQSISSATYSIACSAPQ